MHAAAAPDPPEDDGSEATGSTYDAVRRSAERYRGLVESQHDLIVRVTPDGVFTFVNDAYCRKFGKARGELLGGTFMPLVHEEDRAAAAKAMADLQQPPYRIRLEQRALTADGWRWIEWEDAAIRDGEGRISEVQAVGRDITERKAMEEELRRTHRELVAARDGERSRLADVFHESIGQGLVALRLALYASATDPQNELGDRIRGQLEDSIRQVDALVQEARRLSADLHPPTLKTFGLCSALRQLGAGYADRAAVRVLCAQEAVCERFPQNVEIALFRIGQEALADAVRRGRAKHVDFSVSAGDGVAQLRVIDDSTGLDPAADRDSGAALRTLRARAQAEGGTLEVQSRPGETILTARVPLAADG